MNDKLREDLGLEQESVFLKLGTAGLIGYSDYLFLLTILSSENLFNFIPF